MLFKRNIFWKKYGLFIKNNKDLKWSITHAMIPSPEEIGDGIFKIYFSGRNKDNQSHITWAKVDLNEPFSVIEHALDPVLSPGDLGCFDDNGVTPSCIIDLNRDEKALYYIGWNPGSTVRMHLFGGLAISNDGGKSFLRYSKAPIIERNICDPYLNTAPFVIKIADNEFRMYYVSGHEWVNKNLPRYNIKVAFSENGKDWNRKGKVCIDFKNEKENALARPFVIYDDDVWKMWFAYKETEYQLGYAESLDGIEWTRKDGFACLARGKNNDFDSEMVEYAAVVKYNKRFFMFYNGNNYGVDGIGLAVEEK